MKKIMVLLIMFGTWAGIHAQDTIYVPTNQPSIQEGINAATNGDIVLVDDGVYFENINFKGKAITVASRYIVDKDISHIQNTIIDGSQPANPDSASVVYFFSGEDTTSILCGFTITGGSGTWVNDGGYDLMAGGGLFLSDAGATIMHNIIEDNHLSYNLLCSGGGISAGPTLGPVPWIKIIHNKIRNNSVSSVSVNSVGGGMDIYSNAIIKNNEITNNESYAENHSTFVGGVMIWGAFGHVDFTLENNLIAYNKTYSDYDTGLESAVGSGLYIRDDVSGVVRNNHIKGNEVIGSTRNYAAGILLHNTDTTVTIQNNIIDSNYPTGGVCWGGGICILSGAAIVTYNLIINNKATYGGGIADYYDGQKSYLISNTIANDTATISGSAIYLENTAAEISNSILWGNYSSAGSVIANVGSQIEVSYSDIENSWPGTGNINLNPLFDTIWEYRLTESSPCIDAGDPGLPTNPDGTPADMGCYPFFQGTQINVAKDGSGHFYKIQEAIDVSTEGDLVLVYDGTYMENINFLGKAITVASQYYVNQNEDHISNTIIDGSQPCNIEFGATVSFLSGEDTNSVINGFTITGGIGHYTPPSAVMPFPVLAGGGIVCSTAGPKILNNYVHGNKLSFLNGYVYGGGISCGPIDFVSYPVIEHNKVFENEANGIFNPSAGGIYLFNNGRIRFNEVYDNLCYSFFNQSAGGGIVVQGPVPTVPVEVIVSNNEVHHNEVISPSKGMFTNWGGIGGGMILYACKGDVEKNLIYENTIAAHNADSSTSAGVLIEHCTDELNFSGNYVADNSYDSDIGGGECYGGGVGIFYSGATLCNNVIVRNAAKYGGGICIADTTVNQHKTVLINNTLSENNADSLGGGMFVELWPDFIPGNQHDTVILLNNILWGDISGDNQEIHHVRGDMFVRYSDIEGELWPGDGNINIDPKFIDDTCHIDIDTVNPSPCSGHGIDQIEINAEWVYCPIKDFDGDVRPWAQYTMPDIGADEIYTPPPNGISDTESQQDLEIHLYPNPCKQSCNLTLITEEQSSVIISILNHQGQIIKSISAGHLLKGEHLIRINVADLTQGVYICRVIGGNSLVNKKLMVIR